MPTIHKKIQETASKKSTPNSRRKDFVSLRKCNLLFLQTRGKTKKWKNDFPFFFIFSVVNTYFTHLKTTSVSYMDTHFIRQREKKNYHRTKFIFLVFEMNSLWDENHARKREKKDITLQLHIIKTNSLENTNKVERKLVFSFR